MVIDPYTILETAGVAVRSINSVREIILGIQGAPKLVESLSDDLAWTAGAMTDIESLLKELESSGTQIGSGNSLKRALENIAKAVNEINNLLAKYLHANNLNIWKKFRIHLKEKDISRLEKGMDRCKQDANLALHFVQNSKLDDIRRKQDEERHDRQKLIYTHERIMEKLDATRSPLGNADSAYMREEIINCTVDPDEFDFMSKRNGNPWIPSARTGIAEEEEVKEEHKTVRRQVDDEDSLDSGVESESEEAWLSSNESLVSQSSPSNKCWTCDKSFSSRNELFIHLDSTGHAVESKPEKKSPIPTFESDSEEAWLSSNESLASQSSLSNKCWTCDISFNSRNELLKHLHSTGPAVEPG